MTGENENRQIEFNSILRIIESREDLDKPIRKRQLRYLWTAFVIYERLDVDTYEYDNKMMKMWDVLQKNKSSSYSPLEYERFYNEMSQYLV